MYPQLGQKILFIFNGILIVIVNAKFHLRIEMILNASRRQHEKEIYERRLYNGLECLLGDLSPENGCLIVSLV